MHTNDNHCALRSMPLMNEHSRRVGGSRPRPPAVIGVLALMAFGIAVGHATPVMAQNCEDVFAPVAPTLDDGSYLIDSEANLVYLSGDRFADSVTGGGELWGQQNFLQTTDLDLDGCEFTPIGDLSGSYDGGGTTISGLKITSTASYQGFFSQIVSAGKVKNLRFEGVNIDLSGSFVGTVAGYSEGSILNVEVVSGVVKGKAYIGGLVGEKSGESGSVIDSSVGALVEVEAEDDFAGGLVAYLNLGTIENSHSSATVTANDYAGGVAGLAFNSIIRDSSATGHITVTQNAVGGLVGEVGASDDSPFSFEGNPASIIESSYASGQVTITEATSFGNVGGFAGGAYSAPGCSNCQVIIADSHATGSVEVLAVESGETPEGVGGFIGTIGGNGVSVFNAYATGDVTSVAGFDAVGGLIGENRGMNIENVYATGNVVGVRRVGGLVGGHINGTITNAYATGDVTGTNEVGGLMGYREADLTNTFSTGLVTGDTKVGGLIGDADDGETTASFWDVDTSGIPDVSDPEYGIGKTTAELTQFATYEAAWNTPSIVIVEGWQPPNNPSWGICAEVNSGYPFLLWQFDEDPCSSAEGSLDNEAIAVPPVPVPVNHPWFLFTLVLMMLTMGLVAGRHARRI